ncbi:MAG: hypothetical protein ACTSRZ_20980, partial [Promethearchaeota archaeon]
YPLYPLLSTMKDKKNVRLLVHDLEQKTFFFVIPLITIVIFTTYPFVQLWIGQNVRIISISIILIVSAFILGSITTLPNYQFLIAKGYADKTIVLHASNVFFNALFFFATFKWLGYYAAVVGNVTAIMSSFVLSLYYQKKYLDSLIFDNWRQIGNLLVLLVVNVIIGYLFSLILNSYWIKIILIPVIILISNLFVFKYLKFYKEEDILRYIGRNSRIKMIVFKLLFR